MPPAPAAVLLAAGSASRYGSPKQLAEIDGVPLVRRAAQAILECGAELSRLSGAGGARRVLENNRQEVRAVAMPEAALDIDQPEDHRRALALLAAAGPERPV